MRVTRSCLLLLAFSALVLSLSGCGMSREDREFYLGGWVRPTDLDKPTPGEVRRHQAAEDGSHEQPSETARRDAVPAPMATN